MGGGVDHPDYQYLTQNTTYKYNQSFFLLTPSVGDFVIGRMCTAHSTACVERMFSMLDSIKGKRRNRMITSTVDDIMRIRSYLYNRSMCCKDLEITPRMVALHNINMYSKPKSDSEIPDQEVDDQGLEEIIDLMPSMPPHM